MSAHNVLEQIANADWERPDPGDAGILDVPHQAIFSLVSGASGETRTLGEPTKAGLRCSLCMKTDGGGDIAVTVANSGTVDGSNGTMTFADAGDILVLESFRVGASFVWRIIVNIGSVGLS